jgi:hypothetical protein
LRWMICPKSGRVSRRRTPSISEGRRTRQIEAD